jgi:hypothetical protein
MVVSVNALKPNDVAPMLPLADPVVTVVIVAAYEQRVRNEVMSAIRPIFRKGVSSKTVGFSTDYDSIHQMKLVESVICVGGTPRGSRD